MANISSIIERFVADLSDLPDEGGHETVAALLQPALEEEHNLRLYFAQQPDLALLDNLFLGLVNVFTVPTCARRSRPRPLSGLQIGYDFPDGVPYLFPQHYLLPLHPPLRRKYGSPAIVDSLEQFRANWDIFTHQALSKIPDWNNIVAAGGSVLACLSALVSRPSNVEINNFFQSNAYADSDIDLFLWGITPQQAKEKMENIYNSIKSALPWPVVCVRTVNAISIRTTFPIRPIQIILRLYRSPAEILAGFDVDAACCLYNGHDVYVSPRALAACIRQANSVDLSRRSPSYEVRLAKYANRGFEIFLPSLDRTRLNYNLLYSNDLECYPKGLGRLIVLELLTVLPDQFPRIYSPRQTFMTEQDSELYQPVDFKPVEKTLYKNNYDSIWIRIPYRYDWNAERVKKHVKKIDDMINSPYNPDSRGLHRHGAFCGTMTECLADFCPSCPLPKTSEEQDLILTEASKFIRGPVEFIRANPGRQMAGSFNPIDAADWSSEAYTDDVDVSETIASNYVDEDTEDRLSEYEYATDNRFYVDAMEEDQSQGGTDTVSMDIDTMNVDRDESEGSVYYSEALSEEDNAPRDD